MLNSTIYDSLVKVNAKVELYDGSTLDLKNTCSCNNELETFSISREGDKSKFFGFGICQKLTCTLIDLNNTIHVAKGDIIKLYFGSLEDDVWDKPSPTFYVDDVERDEKSDSISITAYDKLYQASEHFLDELADISTATYNLSHIADKVGSILGISTRYDLQPDANMYAVEFTYGVTVPNYAGNENFRTILNYIAEASQTIYFIDGTDELVFISPSVSNEPHAEITKDDYFELSIKDPAIILETICTVTELGENISAIRSDVTAGVTQYIKENPYLNLRDGEEVGAILNKAIDTVGGIALTQFNCDWNGDYRLQIGDTIRLTASDDTLHDSILFCDTISYVGAINQITEWEYTQDNSETAANSANLGAILSETSAKVDKANKKITLVVEEVQQYDDRIASLEITTEGVTTTVTNLTETTKVSTGNIEEQIEQLTEEVSTKVSAQELNVTVRNEIANGVDKVTTTTGFTFNEEGLTIEKSGREMKTQITEDGMTVYRDTTAVLTADNTGVDAKNLKASTYLIIGTNSRFENYGTTRTACFWIGD